MLYGGKAYSLNWPDGQYEVVPELRHELFEADQGLVYVGMYLCRQGAGFRLTVRSEVTDVRLAVHLCLGRLRQMSICSSGGRGIFVFRQPVWRRQGSDL